MARQQLLAPIRDRYRASSKKDQSRILDEFIAVTGHHRKHGIRLIGKLDDDGDPSHPVKSRRIYDEAVRAAVIVIWEAADRICGKAPEGGAAPSGGVHGAPWPPRSRPRGTRPAAGCQCSHLGPSPETDPSHSRAAGADAGVNSRWENAFRYVPTPAHNYNDWDRPPPGFLEIDLVAHCGGPLSGSFIHSLVATDICTGWTEAVPLLAREQSLVVEGLEAIGQRLPFRIRGIDSDKC